MPFSSLYEEYKYFQPFTITTTTRHLKWKDIPELKKIRYEDWMNNIHFSPNIKLKFFGSEEQKEGIITLKIKIKTTK